MSKKIQESIEGNVICLVDNPALKDLRITCETIDKVENSLPQGVSFDFKVGKKSLFVRAPLDFIHYLKVNEVVRKQLCKYAAYADELYWDGHDLSVLFYKDIYSWSQFVKRLKILSKSTYGRYYFDEKKGF